MSGFVETGNFWALDITISTIIISVETLKERRREKAETFYRREVRKMRMRVILIKIWQGKLTAGQALNELQDEFIRDGPRFRRWKKEKEEILYVLEALASRAITVNETEEELTWILNTAAAKKKKICQPT